MAEMPQPTHSTANAILAAYEADQETPHRPHLGASKIGHSCERHLWYTFRWAHGVQQEGRMLRLFETGHQQEARIVANLRRIGVEFHDVGEDGKQWRVSALGGHFGGSMDGAGLGFPEAPKTWHVGEFKTANDKSFKLMLKDGVRKAKPQHFSQMQIYMGLTGMTRAMYIMINKNDDSVYSERVEFDAVIFAQLMAKAERVIRAAEPPIRAHTPDYWECKFCDHNSICHGDQVPEVNCRTCANSTPIVDGSDDQRWSCSLAPADISIDIPIQREGCGEHRFIPIFLEKTARQVDFVNGDVIYEMPDGSRFANGDGTNGTFSSAEIRRCGGKPLLGELAELKKQFPGSRVTA